MWIAIHALFYSLGPVFALLTGLGRVFRTLRRRRWDGDAWGGLALIVLTLTGRWWIRLMRPKSSDDPRPLTPTRRGQAAGWGGVRLEWEQFGPDDAPAALLSHGWALTHDTWYYQKKALAGEFRVIVWDMRGMGRSATPGDGDYSLRALVHDLAAVFDATDAGRHPQGCVLAGHSLGAMLLPLFAQQFPERMARVRGLALLAGTDTPLLETMRGRRWLVPAQKPIWEPIGWLMGTFPWLVGAYARLIWQMGIVHLAGRSSQFVGGQSRGQEDLVAWHCAFVSMRAAGRGFLSCLHFDARAAMTAINVPVLLLTGEHDINMPPEIQAAMASRLRRPELALMPDCGHLNLLECHAEVSARLADFARRCLHDATPRGA